MTDKMIDKRCIARFNKPPCLTSSIGEPRRVGFEFELSGLKLEPLAEEIVKVFGGEIKRNEPLSFDVENTEFGTFCVEMDSQMVQKAAVDLTDSPLPKTSPNDEASKAANGLLATSSDWYDKASRKAGKTATSFVTGVAELVVPYEIVTPPLPFSAFSQLAELIETLHHLEAEGTRSSLVNAFGMHINPEIYSDDITEIRDVLRAFLLLYPFLKSEMGIDLSRRMLTYIDPFPNDYIKLVLALEYEPDLKGFISDYIAYNPTRNRALDLLPLFAHLAEEHLDQLANIDKSLVKARPTFHYRLPNCEVDNPSWNIDRDWNLWVEVERLAVDKDRLKALSEEYLAFLNGPLNGLFGRDWVAHISANISANQAEGKPLDG